MNIQTTFPWPVVNDGDSISAESYTTDLSIESNPDRFRLLVKHRLDSETINELIKNDKARFATEISCPATNYRDCRLSSDEEQEIIIPSNLLRDLVRVSYYVISIQNIDSYSNPHFHSDYINTNFNLGTGSVLAVYLEESVFDAKKRYAGSVHMTPYMTFIPRNVDEGEMYVNCAGPKITIQLPLPDHKRVTGLLRIKAPDIDTMVESAYAFPAMLTALSEAFEDPSVNEGKFWYQCIKKSVEGLGIEWERGNIILIAQSALRLPETRASEALERLAINNTESESSEE